MKDFYRGKRVFVTGHTGFKGSWLCKILTNLGAQVTGYALQPPTTPNLYELAASDVQSHIADIADLATLTKALAQSKAEIVIHMAAQPLVRESYRDPVYTYQTNVMGTVNLLEAIRIVGGVQSVLNVTTDKVYRNLETGRAYVETDELNGYDPYSNSKSCSELVTSSYKNSFFAQLPVSTARAGNVIGGGDFAQDRIIPDCVRSALSGEEIVVRNPYSVRPYQHVLEPLFAYLRIVMMQQQNPALQGNYNIGPNESDCVETGTLVSLFCDAWGEGLSWIDRSEKDAVHEANFLQLDCKKAQSTFGIQPVWNAQTAIRKTVEWTKCYQKEPADVPAMMQQQIQEYIEGMQCLNK